MSKKISKGVLIIFKTVLAVTLLTALLLSVDLSQVLQIIASVRPLWGLACILAGLVLIWSQGVIFAYVASPYAHIPNFRLFAVTLVGRFFSLFLPSGVGGDLVKAFYLFPYFPRPTVAYAAMAAHRVIGGASTIAVAVVSCLLFLPRDQKGPALVLAVAMVVFGGISLFVWRKYNKALEKMIVQHRDKTAGSVFFRTLYSLVGALSSYRNKKKLLFLTFVFSTVSSLLVAATYSLIAYSLNIPLEYWQALVASSATMVAVLVPVTPGSVGISEGAFVLVGAAVGIPHEQALSMAIVARLMGYICAVPGGIIYMLMPIGKDKRVA